MRGGPISTERGASLKRGTLFFIAAWAVVHTVHAATPVISTVSGTVATGATLTVTGSNFMNEDRTSWDPFFTASASGFEGVNLQADGYGSSCANATYDGAVRLMGNKSIRTRTEGASTYPAYGACAYQWTPSLGTSDLYVRVYSRWNVSGGWPDQDIKYWWLGGGNNYFLNLIPNGGAAPSQIGFYSPVVNNGNWLYGNFPGGAIRNGRWYLIEMHFIRPGFGPPYGVDVWVDNQLVISSRVGTDGPIYNPAGWGWESNTNYWNTAAGFLSDHWQDGFAVASQRINAASSIEIADGPDYAAAFKKYQEPLLLSDGSVQIKADLTGLESGPYYLFVTNNRQERSAAYPLGGADAVPPAAPRGLGVR